MGIQKATELQSFLNPIESSKEKMKNWSVEVVSTSTIKPSFPTPNHMRCFKQSMLDMIAPPLVVPLLLFYPSNGNDPPSAVKSSRLKTSLSETLTRVYPYAGRLKEDHLIDCNDEGVEFVEAQVGGELSEFLKQPNAYMYLSQFLPRDHARLGRDRLLAIQTNQFECGGLAIGIYGSHLVADMATMNVLIQSWAATTRGTGDASFPTFEANTIFPPREVVWSFHDEPSLAKKIMTKNFAFSNANIDAMRAKGAGYSCVERRYTSVELVSALIWRCMIRATRKEEGSTSNRVLVASHVVNLRPRMEPPLSNYSFGNIWCLAVTSGITEEFLEEAMHGQLEEEIGGAIRKIDANFIRLLQGPEGHLKILEAQNRLINEHSIGNIDFCRFSSWRMFPIYEVDFGWGTPIWVATAPMHAKNFIILLGRKDNDGMEAWVNMEENDIAKFEADEELLSYIVYNNHL